MKKLFKVVCKGVTYGTYNTIEKARSLRNILSRRGKSEVVIRVTEEDLP
jgi:hypothetical protein